LFGPKEPAANGGEHVKKTMTDDSTKTAETATLLFKDQGSWETWLARNSAKSAGVWLRFAKKGSAIRSLTYAEALDVALCHGWIDGQKRPESADAYLTKFTPRGKRSIWSKINREKAEALIKGGRMQPRGHTEIHSAKEDGRWDRAYDSPGNATVPEDFQAALDKNPAAKKFFLTLERRNSYAILFRIQTVKRAETRARKIDEFIAMLKRNEKIHP
jgi:uncharacterized protein YdeI (YjbR/CyaY-like superfamily)